MLCPMPDSHIAPIVPDWPAPPSVHALCSTRDGGVSEGCYAGLNLGLHVGDAPPAVLQNRTQLQATMGVRAVFLEQVHGTDILAIEAATHDGGRVDAAYTRQANIACTVMVADCLPVLFCNVDGTQVAAAHAGWRGLLGTQGRGILEATVASFDKDQELLAWLGPCIGPEAFEVGDEVRSAFVAASPQAAICFKQKSAINAQAPVKWLADLPALARQRLQALGIARTYGNDGGQNWCTVSNASRFFSHRRDGVSGRMAAAIWRSA